MSETPIHITKLAERLRNCFYGTKGYWTTATDKIREEDGKKLHETRKIPEQLDLKHYEEHLISEKKGLTISPLYSKDEVYFGAIDVDTYKWDEQKKRNFLEHANRLNLVAARTKSNGIHLYAFTGEDNGVPAPLMINRLKNCRDQLELPELTEIFPKQDCREEDAYGNGITIPFRSFCNKKDEFKTMGLSVFNNEIKEDNIGVFCDRADRQIKHREFNLSFYKQFEKYVDPIQAVEDEADKHQITRPEILKNIRSKKEHWGGGTFDNWILLYVAKAVKDMETDRSILIDLDRVREFSDKADDQDIYFKKKIYHCRKKFGITDPDKMRQEVKRRLVHILEEDKLFDLVKNKSYKPEVVDKVFGQFFKKPACSNWLKQQPDKIEVENWVWDPQNYNPKNKVVEIEGLKYLNSYKPNDLKAVEGDTTLWIKLLDYVFINNKKHKDQFLDWLAYQVQHIGTKLRYAIVIYSKNYQIGKGSIWRVIEKVFGIHNTKEIDVDQAIDHAKEYLRNSAIVCIDEMESTGTFSQKRTLLNAMKRIITAGKLGHRARYSDYSNVPTKTNYILFTNNKDALSLPKNEERYSVYMHELPRLPQEFYDEFHQWIDNEEEAKLNRNHDKWKDGARFILHELLLRDVNKFNPHKVAPATSFNGTMSEAGAHPLSKLLKEKYDGNFFPLRKDIVSTMGVYNYLKENKELGRFRTNDIANALEFIGGQKLEQVPIKLKDETKRMTLFVIRNHSEYRDMDKADIGKAYWEWEQKDFLALVDKETGNRIGGDLYNDTETRQDNIIPPKPKKILDL